MARDLISVDEKFSSRRYEPLIINLENKNSSHTLLIILPDLIKIFSKLERLPVMSAKY